MITHLSCFSLPASPTQRRHGRNPKPRRLHLSLALPSPEHRVMQPTAGGAFRSLAERRKPRLVVRSMRWSASSSVFDPYSPREGWIWWRHGMRRARWHPLASVQNPSPPPPVPLDGPLAVGGGRQLRCTSAMKEVAGPPQATTPPPNLQLRCTPHRSWICVEAPHQHTVTRRPMERARCEVLVISWVKVAWLARALLMQRVNARCEEARRKEVGRRRTAWLDESGALMMQHAMRRQCVQVNR